MSPSEWDVIDDALADAAAETYRRCEAICRAYGVDGAPTQAERRAYISVLDRMGAFAASERATLRAGGLL
jgi:hypothetical protein